MEQDARFYNNEKKLLKRLKYPPNIGTKVAKYTCIVAPLARAGMSAVVRMHSLFAGRVSGGHEQGELGHHQAVDHAACD